MCIYDTIRYACTGEEISLVQRCPMYDASQYILCIPHIRFCMFRTSVCRLCAIAGLEQSAVMVMGAADWGGRQVWEAVGAMPPSSPGERRPSSVAIRPAAPVREVVAPSPMMRGRAAILQQHLETVNLRENGTSNASIPSSAALDTEFPLRAQTWHPEHGDGDGLTQALGTAVPLSREVSTSDGSASPTAAESWSSKSQTH
ncbi:hypothetical protein LTR85_003439 [Meristemomyces frigidus]|nr:hypothetical protein LTR85_003439 [Meristemomyces frigidus]